MSGCKPPCAPFIDPRRSRMLQCLTDRAFCRMAGSGTSPDVIKLEKRTTNTAESLAFGDALPAFEPPVTLAGIVETEPTRQNEGAWGTDERTQAIVYLRSTEVTFYGINNRDRLIINDSPHNILSTHVEDGVGGHELGTVLRVAPQTQEPT